MSVVWQLVPGASDNMEVAGGVPDNDGDDNGAVKACQWLARGLCLWLRGSICILSFFPFNYFVFIVLGYSPIS
jgi:hypothetical protein